MTRSTRARLLHALSLKRLMALMLVIGACNIGLQAASLIQSVMGLPPLIDSILETSILLALFLVPVSLMVFRYWAVQQGWPMVYAQSVPWLDVIVGVMNDDDFPKRVIPTSMQHELAKAVMARGWISWADVCDCASKAGLPAPHLSVVMTFEGRRPASKQDMRSVIDPQVWEAARSRAQLLRHTTELSDIRLVPPARF